MKSSDLGEWLSEHRWHHYVTLTNRPTTSVRQLVREFERRFVRWLQRVAQRHVSYFFAVEGAETGHPHLHVLLDGTRDLTTTQLRRHWPGRNTHVEVYDPRRGATDYVSKDVLKDCSEWNISRRMPPKRRPG